MDQPTTARLEACDTVTPEQSASPTYPSSDQSEERAFVVKEVDVAAINFELGHIWPNVS